MLCIVSFLSALCVAPLTVQADLDSLQVRTGALFLHRSDNNDDTIVRGTGGTPLLNSSQVSPGGNVGWELSVIGRCNDDFAIEARYFQLDDFSYSSSLTNSPGGMGFAIDDETMGFFAGTGPIVGAIDYNTDLYSIEVNERWRMNDRIDFLVGVRHIQNKETLRGVFTDSVVPGTSLQFDADNYLSGAQIGFDALLLERNRFRLEGLVKLGAYHNIVRTAYGMDFNNGSTIASEHAADRRDGLSLLGELQVTGVYRLCDRVSLRGGYQLLFMTDIATATNQVVETDSAFINNTTPVRTRSIASDSPIYHGLSLQLEFWLHKSSRR